MAKKKSEELETIVENEPVVINEADIVNENEVNESEVINVEASEVIIENSLKVQIAFTDKYDNTKHYKVGDLLENLSEERYNELINDPRKLVCKAY